MEASYDPNKWFSLRFAIYHFWRLREKFGTIVITSNKFQKEREAWIVAATLLGITKLSGNLWWIKIPEEDPPDILAMTLTQNKEDNWNYLLYRKVEVMEITKNSSRDIVSEIMCKLKNKYYEKETCLLVYLRRDSNIRDMRVLAKKLQGKIRNLADIWVLGNTHPNTNKYVLFSLYPDVQAVNYDLDEEIVKLPQGDTVDISRSKSTKMDLVKGIFIAKFNPRSKSRK